MNEGSGRQKYGFNGFEHYPGVRPGDITDGLSNTAAVCERYIYALEFLEGLTDHPERRFFGIARPMSAPAELEDFAKECRDRPRPLPPLESVADVDLEVPNMGYNHILTPNLPTCWNGPNPNGANALAFAAVTASSPHPGGVNLLLADGSCRFIGNSIDVGVWRALASRAGGDIVPEF